MRMLVMGSGAVGGYFGAVLHRAGHDVTFVARGEHLAAIRGDGLKVESKTAGDFTIHPEATERPDGSWKADLVMFCVKGYDNPQAIDTMRPAVGDQTAILTLQNGIGSGDELGSAFGAEKVLLGVTYVDAVRKEPGLIGEWSDRCNIIFGRQDGAITAATEAVRDALDVPGIDLELSSNVVKDLWEKLIFVSAWSGMISVTQTPMAHIMQVPEAKELTFAALREAEAVARAEGVAVDGDFYEKTTTFFQEVGEEAVSSMFLDLQAGKPLEVSVLNGSISKRGREKGVPTPVSDFITGCLLVPHSRAVARRA